MDLTTGVDLGRQVLIEIVEMGVSTGTEILSPSLVEYYEDLISWGCIGARTAESQTHRELASSMNIPIGFKNNTCGNFDIAIDGIIAASGCHQLIRIVNGEPLVVDSKGNVNTHVVLRGRNYPDLQANYDISSVRDLVEKLENAGLPTGFLIDCSHGNAMRDPLNQITAARSALEHRSRGLPVRGILIESHIRRGSAVIHPPIPDDISITDPCIGWEETRRLILEIRETILRMNDRVQLTN
jgi:3-deoxy-7-phosphoheptulonate synthase